MGLGLVGDDVGGAAALDEADVEGGGADFGLDGQGHGEDVVEGGDELVDGRLAQLWVGGVGHAAPGADLNAKCTLGG